jgi:hypothetical protein
MFDVPQELTRIKPTPAKTRPPNWQMSETRRYSLLLICKILACQDLIGDHRSGDRQQRQDGYDRNGFHLVNVAPDCGRKGQSSVPFRDNAGI